MQRKTLPGDHHRPTLDAAQAVDTLLLRKGEQIFQSKDTWSGYQPTHLQLPRRATERCGEAGNLLLISREFVVVVVVGNLLEAIEGIT